MSMSNSEIATHQFTDGDVFSIEVGEWYAKKSIGTVRGVYFSTDNPDSGGVSCTFLSKADLLHLLTLIEETN